MGVTKNHLIGAFVGCACCCIIVAFTASSAAFVMMALYSGPELGGRRNCASCPGRRCAKRGYAATIAETTEEKIAEGMGLVDCLCDLCRSQCNSGGISMFSLATIWTDSQAWYDNVYALGGVCMESTNDCSWGSICRATDGPKVDGTFCTDAKCL